jgi:thymidylate kinase
MLKTKLLYLCGIDGSGKTTQMSLIANQAAAKGIKYKYVWLRWVALFSYVVYGVGRVLGYTKWKPNPRNNGLWDEHYFYRNPIFSKIWVWMFTIDYSLFTFFRLKLPLWSGRLVLCDRFVIDALVDLMYETRDYALCERLIGRLVFSLLPKESLTIMLDISEEEAYRRKLDIPLIQPIRDRRKLYQMIAKKTGVMVINAEQDCFIINQIIQQRLNI